jgi:hypothetical protein
MKDSLPKTFINYDKEWVILNNIIDIMAWHYDDYVFDTLRSFIKIFMIFHVFYLVYIIKLKWWQHELSLIKTLMLAVAEPQWVKRGQLPP